MTANPILNPHLEGAPFYWAGSPTGILLTHGFTATTAEVRPLARFLHERGFTVAGPLLPGHGTHLQDLNQVRWQDWLAAADDCYRQLRQRCTRVIVGGESTGGILALYLASKYPEITALLCYAPALRLKLSRLDILLVHALSPFVTAIPKKNVQTDTLWQGYTANPLKGVIQLLRLQQEVRRRLPAVRQPLLIVQGRLDPTVHPATPDIIARSVASKIKQIYWMEESAHCVIIDREREQVAEISLQFIEQVLAGSGERPESPPAR